MKRVARFILVLVAVLALGAGIGGFGLKSAEAFDSVERYCPDYMTGVVEIPPGRAETAIFGVNPNENLVIKWAETSPVCVIIPEGCTGFFESVHSIDGVDTGTGNPIPSESNYWVSGTVRGFPDPSGAKFRRTQFGPINWAWVFCLSADVFGGGQAQVVQEPGTIDMYGGDLGSIPIVIGMPDWVQAAISLDAWALANPGVSARFYPWTSLEINAVPQLYYQAHPELTSVSLVSEFYTDIDDTPGVKVGVEQVVTATGEVLPSMDLSQVQMFLVQPRYCSEIPLVRSMSDADVVVSPDGKVMALVPGANGDLYTGNDLALVIPVLTGSALEDCDLTIQLVAARNLEGTNIPISVGSVDIPLRRGDAQPNARVSIGDALFVAQYLVGIRELCAIGEVELCLHAINAASARHDNISPQFVLTDAQFYANVFPANFAVDCTGVNQGCVDTLNAVTGSDRVSIADALFIAQYLVGLRDEYFVLVE